MEKERIKSIIESLLFISGEPLSLDRLMQVLKEVDRKQVREVIEELRNEYEAQARGLRIAEVAGGYQIETARENAEYLARLVKTRPIRLTRPSLESLAIIAYRQPITRLEVDQIRGVDSSGVIKTLLEYGFIQVVGRKEVPGRPLLYGTSKKFLEFFRLKSLSDLPSLEEFVAQAEERVSEGGGLFENRFKETPEEGLEPKPGQDSLSPSEENQAQGSKETDPGTDPWEKDQ